MAAPALGAVLSGEAGPDGVRAALRSSPMRGGVRRTLQGLLASGASLGPVRIERVKLKPGRKLSAWGRAAVADGSGVRVEVPVSVTWVPPAVFAPAPGVARLTGRPAALRAWHAVDEGTGMELLASPFDPAAPELPALFAPGAVPGRPLTTTVRYRPRQRHVLRYDAEDRGAAPCWAKLVPGRDGAVAAATAEALADGLAERGATAAVRPLGLLVGGAVLYPSARGRPLPALFRTGRPWPLDALHHVGAALRQLHDLPEGAVPATRGVTVEDDLAAVARAGEHLGALDPAAARVLDAILQAARVVLTDEGEPVSGHGDCKLDHFWLDGGTVTFIDLDSAAVADPARDLGKLLADLRWWTARAGLRDLDRARVAVAAGYGHAERWDRARSWEALLLAKAVVRRCSLLDPRWAADTRTGLRHAATLLDLPTAA